MISGTNLFSRTEYEKLYFLMSYYIVVTGEPSADCGKFPLTISILQDPNAASPVVNFQNETVMIVTHGYFFALSRQCADMRQCPLDLKWLSLI